MDWTAYRAFLEVYSLQQRKKGFLFLTQFKQQALMENTKKELKMSSTNYFKF